jgi:uncharacterized UPF0160 family protein
MPLIATHSGSFHADDVFGVAVLALVFPEHTLVRSREPEVIARADFVVDVGGVWDPARGRFDHHQRGFEGARVRTDAQGQPVRAEGYASAGLVWREFGRRCVRQLAQAAGHPLDEGNASRIADDLDRSLVRYLDLVDTGASDVAPGVFGLSSQVALLNSTWLEEQGLDAPAAAALHLERFREAMALVQRAVQRFVLRGVGQLLAADKVRAGERLLGGRVLHLPEGAMPWTRVVVDEMPEVLLVIYPEADGAQHVVRTVPAGGGGFQTRLDFPAAWAGFRGEQLVAVTGVPDAVFCHTNLFIAIARSLAGAVRLAELALAAAPGSAGAAAEAH